MTIIIYLRSNKRRLFYTSRNEQSTILIRLPPTQCTITLVYQMTLLFKIIFYCKWSSFSLIKKFWIELLLMFMMILPISPSCS